MREERSKSQTILPKSWLYILDHQHLWVPASEVLAGGCMGYNRWYILYFIIQEES
jgi:hypothetical protein